MNIVRTHNIYINSSQRVSGTSNDFVVFLKQPLVLKNQKNYFQVRVDKAIIPHTIKQINSSNNVLSYTFTRTGVNYNGSITLTAGNYTILTLISEFQNKLVASIYVGLGYTVTFPLSYNRNTGTVNFVMNGTDGVTSSLLLKFSTNPKLGLVFGVTADISLSYNTLNVGTIVTSSQNVNVNPTTYLTIRSNTLKQRQNYESIVEKDVYADILAVVPINVSPGSFIIYDRSPQTELVNNIIDVLEIYLADNQNYSISLNGLEWSISLIFEEIGINEPDDLVSHLASQNNVQPTNNPLSQLEQQREAMLSELEQMKNQYVSSLESDLGSYPHVVDNPDAPVYAPQTDDLSVIAPLI
jgi:hypothetical protein